MQTPGGWKIPFEQGSSFGIVSGSGNSLWPSSSHQSTQGGGTLSQPAQSTQAAAGVTPPDKTSCRKGLEARGSRSPGTDPTASPGDTAVPPTPWQGGWEQQPKSHNEPFCRDNFPSAVPTRGHKDRAAWNRKEKTFPFGFWTFSWFFPSINLHIFHLPRWKHGNSSPLPPPKQFFSVSTKVFLEQKKWFGKCKNTFSMEILRGFVQPDIKKNQGSQSALSAQHVGLETPSQHQQEPLWGSFSFPTQSQHSNSPVGST